MVSKLETYFDFAENDYEFFIKSYDMGMIANQMGAIAQGICEKYLKYVIDKCVVPVKKENFLEKENILRTHNLSKLMKYLGVNVPELKLDKNKLKLIDGYYFSTRYPGDESIRIDDEDLELCHKAVEECRLKVMQFMKKHVYMEKQVHDFTDLPSKPKKKSSKCDNLETDNGNFSDTVEK